MTAKPATESIVENSIHIRQATIMDLPSLVPLFDEYRQFYRQKSDLAGDRQFILDRLRYNQSIAFLAFKDTQAVGFTQLYPSFSSGAMAQVFILNDLLVRPQARACGIGSALLQSAAQFARHSVCAPQRGNSSRAFDRDQQYDGSVRIREVRLEARYSVLCLHPDLVKMRAPWFPSAVFGLALPSGAAQSPSMTLGGRLHLISITLEAPDLSASAAFYRDVLGFVVTSDTGGATTLQRDGVELFLRRPGRSRSDLRHESHPQIITMEFSDVPGLFENAQHFASQYKKGSINRRLDGSGSTCMVDPAGNGVLVNPLKNAPNTPEEHWRDPRNRDELVTVSQLPPSIGCTRRFVWAMIRAGYQLQYRALRRTTPRHALEWLAAKPGFRPPLRVRNR